MKYEMLKQRVSILRALCDFQEALGVRVIARCLKDQGIEPDKRAVRYRLKLMNEQGLTQLIGRDGRLIITELGVEELKSALVGGKVSLAIAGIELFDFHIDFNWRKRADTVPVNISFLTKERLGETLQAMKTVFREGLCASDLVVAQEGKKLAEVTVSQGKIGFVTICSQRTHQAQDDFGSTGSKKRWRENTG